MMLWTILKDIHDLDWIHGYWWGAAAVTVVVHNDHEEVAAGNLLYDKGSAAQTETDCNYNRTTWLDRHLLLKQISKICQDSLGEYFRVPDTALTVNVACCFFDGAFRDKRGVLCITRHHCGFTPGPLSWTWQRKCSSTTEVWQNHG